MFFLIASYYLGCILEGATVAEELALTAWDSTKKVLTGEQSPSVE
jgi:hypothetical protein